MGERLDINLSSCEYYLSDFCHGLGTVRRSLAELETLGLLANPASNLEKAGYAHNLAVESGQDVISLASGPFSSLLGKCADPGVVIVHHSYPASTSIGPEAERSDLVGRAPYFPAVLMQRFKLDHVPYLGSFASGCSGVLTLVMKAAGVLAYSNKVSVLCLTADCKPPGATFDMLKEKILTSDAASGFIFGKEKKGVRVLGVSYYSSSRHVIPLVEIVKRSVQMINELSRALGLDGELKQALFHYPNIFTPAWDMVSHYLKARPEQHVLDEMLDRAHCLSSDSVLSLQKRVGMEPGRLHVVLNFGSGLHLGICLLQEV